MKRNKMYFDSRDYILRTHMILQTIKQYGGTKVFLEARRLLLVAWLACKEGEYNNPCFPSLISFHYLLRNLEEVESYNHFSTIKDFRRYVGLYADVAGCSFFSVPYDVFKDKTPHQAHVAIENYIIEKRQTCIVEEWDEWDEREIEEWEEGDDEFFDPWLLH